MKLIKPNFWDYKRPNLLSFILLPFTVPLILKNFLFKPNKNKNDKIKTICVGNIYVGGTGKTPLSIEIDKILKKLNFKTAFIKKKYNSQLDEQKILIKNGKLFCKTKRKYALKDAENSKVKVAIFDDGLQDNSVFFDLTFVCFNTENLYGNGMLIPSGPLREKISSLKKYNAVFLNGNSKNNLKIKSLLKKQNPNIKIFEAIYMPTNLNIIKKKNKYLIFSGIGNAKSFEKTLTNNNFNIVKSLEFPDHYNYTNKDMTKIKKLAKKLNAKILTTEKDYIRLNKSKAKNIKFLKIKLSIFDKKKLINFLKNNL
tara:strand:- start:1089 stop:2024 length:936 start_codon:yes stop_codon:yes gene_type:complete